MSLVYYVTFQNFAFFLDWQITRAVTGSVKACYGHTEGAAGLHSAMAAILGLSHRAAPPVLHSRALNPYVSAALDDWSKSSRLAALIPKVRPFLGLMSW